MRYLFAFALSIFSLLYVPAQNAFVQLFHPQYQELIPLVTDSLFVRIQTGEAGEVTRATSFQYPENLPPTWREVRTQATPLGLCRENRYTEQGGNGLVTYNDFVDSIGSDTLRTKMTTFGNQPGKPDSILNEIWINGQWKFVQKTLFTYISQKLSRRIELNWNDNSDEWDNVYSTTYTYDGQNRVTQREEKNWVEDAWNVQHTYQYAYRPGESKPKYLVWYADSIPIDSTVIWYDFQSKEDSSIVYQWNANQSSWEQQSKRILSSEAAKKALVGDTYSGAGSSSNNWLPKEKREFVAGAGTFTDEPQEELLLVFNATTTEWQDKWRRTITYQYLPDSSRIYGEIHITAFGQDSTWSEIFFAEGWFHLVSDSLNDTPPKDRSDSFTFSYTCGLYNPYVQNQTLTFPASGATGDYELKIFGEDSRLVFQQRYDSNGLGTVSAPLVPGLYLVSVSRGGVPLCTQKLVVH